MNEEKLRIKVQISNKEYSLNITRGDVEREAVIREAAKQINNIYETFKKQYTQSGVKIVENELLAMTCLQIAVSNINTEKKVDTAPLANKLRDLDRDIQDVLNTIENVL